MYFVYSTDFNVVITIGVEVKAAKVELSLNIAKQTLVSFSTFCLYFIIFMHINYFEKYL